MTSTNQQLGKTITRSKEDPRIVTAEYLDNGPTTLTCFFFRHGANLYAFSYETDGRTRHTLIDTGDSMYEDRISAILSQHQIIPENIDRIIITHSHHDHCGLAEHLLRKSGATLLVHSTFRHLIEGSVNEGSPIWPGDSDPSDLQPYDIKYLSPLESNAAVTIDGVDFPSLIDSIQIGDAGQLEILACPESPTMHTPDQVIVLYTPRHRRKSDSSIPEKYRPSDDMLFSGDLWLMHGPLFGGGYRTFTRHVRFAYRHVRGMLKGESPPRRDPRSQDARAKEALKRGFCLIRVLPGHGEDFLGTRMIPNCFLADRDLLIELGYDMNEKKSLLKSPDLAPKVKGLREKAYGVFIDELMLWQKLGYDPDEISGFLIRIYREQSGGGYLVEEDRKERRERIEKTLSRLKEDGTVEKELNAIAASTLEQLSEIW